jgi:uncharacterized C2H2 Zn-finger protein
MVMSEVEHDAELRDAFLTLPGEVSMKCPHCGIAFHDLSTATPLGTDRDGEWAFRSTTCPSCKRFVIQLVNVRAEAVADLRVYLAWPRSPQRPVSDDVPPPYSDDFREAGLVLPDSPKASAAISRRCLQNLLRDKAGVRLGDLAHEIQQVLDSGALPSHLAEQIDGVRNIGNFAAHPIKSRSSGVILDVEPGEAEWLLDTLEGLLDFYFVQPARTQRRREALDEKLKAAGKPPMKKP